MPAKIIGDDNTNIFTKNECVDVSVEEIKFDENNPYGLKDVFFLSDESQLFLKWYSDDNLALAFQFCQGKFQNVLVYIERSSVKILSDKVDFKPILMRNPNNLTQEDFNSEEFKFVLTMAMNDVIEEMLESQNKEKINDN